mmetsp:Transcript_10501/g.15167  ORF Transcript_10501/g.15167 Transcript_10501/m.15167 type:complete len:229 (-) Transcript_10501:78-764(-)
MDGWMDGWMDALSAVVALGASGPQAFSSPFSPSSHLSVKQSAALHVEKLCRGERPEVPASKVADTIAHACAAAAALADQGKPIANGVEPITHGWEDEDEWSREMAQADNLFKASIADKLLQQLLLECADTVSRVVAKKRGEKLPPSVLSRPPSSSAGGLASLVPLKGASVPVTRTGAAPHAKIKLSSLAPPDGKRDKKAKKAKKDKKAKKAKKDKKKKDKKDKEQNKS